MSDVPSSPPTSSDADDATAALQLRLSESPLDFDAHLQLLRHLRSTGEVDALREARLRMASLFPLTADLWHQWLDDEGGRVDGEDDQRRLLALHERSCADYLVPSLWVRYCAYAQELHSDALTDGGLEALSTAARPVREAYGKAAAALHCHCLAAEQVMRPYRQFELHTLTSMLLIKQQHEDEADRAEGEDEDDGDGDDDAEGQSAQEAEDEAAVVAQLSVIQQLYRQSLSSPVNGLEQVYGDYERWVERQQYQVEEDMTRAFKQVTRSRSPHSAHIAAPPRLVKSPSRSLSSPACVQSLEDRTARQPFESALNACGAESSAPTGLANPTQLAAWSAYIDFEQGQQRQSRTPELDRVLVLYERCLAHCFLHPDLWHSYLAWMKSANATSDASAAQRLVALYERALRNIPMDGSLWAGLIRALQRLQAPMASAMEAFHRAQQLFQGRDDHLLPACVALLQHFRRSTRGQLDSGAEAVVAQSLNGIRYTDASVAATAAHLELCLDFFDCYYALQARGKGELQGARAAMEGWINEKGHGVRAWSEWVRLELRAGNVDHARQLHSRAVKQSIQDWALESLAFDWLRFEDEHGTAEQRAEAERQCGDLFFRFAALRTQAAAAASATFTAEEEPSASQERQDSEGQPSSEDQPATPGEAKSSAKPRKDRKPRAARDGGVTAAQTKGQSKKRRQSPTAPPNGDTADASPPPPKRQRQPKPSTTESRAQQPPASPTPSAAEASESVTHPSPPAEPSADDRPAQPAPSAAADGVEAATPPSELAAFHQSPNHVVRVSNVSPQTTPSSLRDFFAQHGQVDAVHLAVDFSTPDSQLAHLLYHSKDAVKAAVAATQGAKLDGRALAVIGLASFNRHRKKEAKAEQFRPLRVFVRGLPMVDGVESLLRTHFADCGDVRRVTLSRDKKTQRLHPFAYVEFKERVTTSAAPHALLPSTAAHPASPLPHSSPVSCCAVRCVQAAAEKALAKDNTALPGYPRPIHVVRDQPPPLPGERPLPTPPSAPPSTRPPAAASTAPSAALAGPPRGERPTKLTLVPRSVRAALPTVVPSAAADEGAVSSCTASGPAASPAPPTTTMSNADFRSFLLQRTAK